MSKSLDNLNGIEIISSKVNDINVPNTHILAHDDVRLDLLHDVTETNNDVTTKTDDYIWRRRQNNDDVIIDGIETNGCIIPESKLHKLPYDLPPKRSHSTSKRGSTSQHRQHSKRSHHPNRSQHSKRSHSHSSDRRKKKRISQCDSCGDANDPEAPPHSAAVTRQSSLIDRRREELSSKDRRIARLIGLIAGMLMLSAFVIVGVALSMSTHIDQMGM